MVQMQKSRQINSAKEGAGRIPQFFDPETKIKNVSIYFGRFAAFIVASSAIET